jgi:hypothetical protein
MQFSDQDVTMISTTSRGIVGAGLVAATASLFDTRVFIWQLREEWCAAGPAAAAPAAAGASGDARQQQPQQQQRRRQQEEDDERLAAARVAAAWDPDATAAEAAAAANAAAGGAPAAGAAADAAAPGAQGAAAVGGAGGGQQQQAQEGAEAAAAAVVEYSELRHLFSTPDNEPIVDISISTAAKRLYIICMQQVRQAEGGLVGGCPQQNWRGADAAFLLCSLAH